MAVFADSGGFPVIAAIIIIVIIVLAVIVFIVLYNGLVGCGTASTTRGPRSTSSSSAGTT